MEEKKVWYGINLADLTDIPGIETMGMFLLPPREKAIIMKRGPNLDDIYVFWELDKSQHAGIDFILKQKLSRIRTETLIKQPKPYKGHLS